MTGKPTDAPADGDGATAVTLAEAWMAAPALGRVVAALADGGIDVRFVGGCVRDSLLGEPVNDVDIGVPLAPDAVVERLETAGLRTIPTGIDHGTVTAVADGTPYEVTSLRRDVETDGRRAVVAFSADWREDALRRDFTINALSLRPDGTVFDYFDGLADLEARRVRFVGDPVERIHEDALRILRFYRFAARFGIDRSDKASRAACTAHTSLLATLSRERVGQELLKTVTAPLAADAAGAMASDGILQGLYETAWLPERLGQMAAIEQAAGLAPDPVRRLAALSGDPARADGLGRSLRLSNRQLEHLVAVVQLMPEATTALGDGNPGEMPVATPTAARAAFYRHGADRWRDAVLLAAADSATPPDRVIDIVQAAAAWERPVLPVRGADLVARGISGPAVGKGLAFVERWWIANDFRPGREEALDKLEEAIALVRAMASGPQ